MKTLFTMSGALMLITITMAQSNLPHLPNPDYSNTLPEDKVLRIIEQDYQNGMYQTIGDEVYDYSLQNSEKIVYRSFSNNNWQNRSQELNLFNVNEHIEQKVVLDWSFPLNQWKAVENTEYTYNGNDQLLKVLTEKRSGQAWNNFYRVDYQYDSSNKTDTVTGSSWNGIDWEPTRLYDWDYTGELLTSKNQYNLENGIWQLTRSETWTYNADSTVHQHSQQFYINGLLEQTSNHVYDYYGGKLRKITQYYFHDQISGIISETEFSYDSNDRLIEREVHSMGFQTLMPDKKFIYEYESVETAIAEKDTAKSIKVYPNPIINIFKLHYSSLPSDCTINIFDLNGRLVFSQNRISSNQLYNVSHLPQGVYLLTVERPNGQRVAQSKILKAQ